MAEEEQIIVWKENVIKSYHFTEIKSIYMFLDEDILFAIDFSLMYKKQQACGTDIYATKEGLYITHTNRSVIFTKAERNEMMIEHLTIADRRK